MKLKTFILTISILVQFHSGSAVLEKAECTYAESEGEGYTCQLLITNPNGWDNFTSIGGNHIGWNRNGDVVTLRRNAGSFTRNFPSIICNTFRNIENFYFWGDFVTEIGENSFSGCMRLRHLIISNHEIERIADNAFRNNVVLRHVAINQNYITDLPINLFTSMNTLEQVNFERNFLQVLHSETFGHQPNFGFLQMNNNLISAFDERLIDNTRIGSVELNRNQCADISVNIRDLIRPALQRCFDNYNERFGRIEEIIES